MWTTDKNFPAREFSTPPPTWKSKRSSPVIPWSERQRASPQTEADLFHVIHKVPAGDSPYVRAKHVQLVDKDPSRAISMFWAAINSGDRVDSALKDMAVVMKQLNRSDEAIEAIKSFRHLCPPESQESLDNVLVELYKRSGRIEEQIEMLEVKLKHIEEGLAFGGKRTKMARSQGKKIQITVEQEYSRLLGNLAWAYLQQNNYKLAEELYRKALSLEQDKNKQCNLAICLMHMKRITEAKFLLQTIKASSENGQMDESYANSFERAFQMLAELESQEVVKPIAWEEENRKEIRTPFSSLSSRYSGEHPTPSNGYNNEMKLLDEQGKGSCFRNHHENKNNLFGFGIGNSKCTSFGMGNGLHSSPQTLFADKLKKDSYSGSPHGRRAYLGTKRNEDWARADGVEGGFAWKKAYASPFPAGRIPEVPFTQPRRCSWSLNNGLQRRAWLQENTGRGCNRSLSFEQPINDENVLQANQNLDGQLPASTNQLSKVAQQKPEYPALTSSGDWRKRPLEDHNKVNSKDFVRAREASPDGDGDRSSNTTIDNSGRLTETVEHISENLKATQELQSQNRPVLEHPQYFLTCKSKKSWADMVEEDESEWLIEFMQPSQEHLFSGLTPSPSSDGCREAFNDENIDSNIIRGTPSQLNQTEKLCLKIESLDLKDGYYTQPENAASSMNRAVRRSLCFEQQQKTDRQENDCSSPLSKKALNFEGYTSTLAKEKECIGSGRTLLRRNRLQAFRDIPLLPESPRP